MLNVKEMAHIPYMLSPLQGQGGGGGGKKKQTEVHPALNPELSTLKPRVGQNIALHVLSTAKNSSLQDPAPHPHFLQCSPQ